MQDFDSNQSNRLEFELCPANKRSGTKQSLTNDRTLLLGSADEADIQLTQMGIESRHARIGASNGQIFIQAIDNHFLTRNGKLVTSNTTLHHGDWLVLGSAFFYIRFPQASSLVPKTSTPEKPKHGARSSLQAPYAQGKSDSTLIGRANDCQLTIESPIVSKHHARLTFSNRNWVLEDLGSTNGTFVNGYLIHNPVVLKPEDRVAIAIYSFVFTGDELKSLEKSGQVRIEVKNLFKQVNDRSGRYPKRLLDRINIVVEPGEFVAIFGTSGSGKSTLMDAMSGRRHASGGHVFYNGVDLYKSFDLYRGIIGYVPQQDIVHRKIKMQNALKYTAHLRLPPDTSDAEIDSYITRILDQVGLREEATLAVDTPVPLSGGQLKRVSLAVELIANPKVLFLDEVTSGLDAGTDKKMMHLFSELTSTGKTVICVTHTLENIEACDLVVLLHQGKLVYFGPPAEALGYFGIHRLSDVYDLLESSEKDDWANRLSTSKIFQQYVLNRFSSQEDVPSALKLANPRHQSKRTFFDWQQTGTLMHRYWDLILADRKNLAILLLQAPLIAIAIGGVFTIEGSLHERAFYENQISFILVLSAIWFGCLNSARELVKELPIYLRERSVNLKIPPYIVSKLIPLSALCIIQCGMLLVIVRILTPLSGGGFDQLSVLFMTGMAATTMGLAVSAFVDSNDKAVATIPILLVPQVILSNAIVPLGHTAEIIARYSMISFWSFDALKSCLGQSTLDLTDYRGEAVVPILGTFGGDMLRIVGFFLAFLMITAIGLMLKDRRK